MGTTTNKLRRPAYSKLLEQAIGKPVTEIMVEVHIGRTAWNRVARTEVDALGRPLRKHHLVGIPMPKVSHLAPAGKWWGLMGFPLVVPLDAETTVADYDFTCLDRLYVLLDATDCSYPTARDCARRICEHGAALVWLVHPQATAKPPFEPGPTGWEFFFGARR